MLKDNKNSYANNALATGVFYAPRSILALCLTTVLLFLLSLFFIADPVSAVSASITTSSQVTLNAVTTGTGVAISEDSIGIVATCDQGYNLTVATSVSPNLYLNGDNTNEATFTTVDGTSALNSNNNINKWGYTLTANATGDTVFLPLSTTASSLRTVSGTTGTTSETFSIYYGVKSGQTTAPGSYSMSDDGTIEYYLTMNPLCNMVNITYDGNNADEGTMAAVHSNVKDGDSVSLVASNFSRAGYGFAGWSLDPNAGTKLLDNDSTNNSIVYGPQETITLPADFSDNDTDNDGEVKLYAVWLQSQGNLQGWAGCANLDTATYDSVTGQLDFTKNSVTALTDQRDNDTYAVARLADGNCWMIENLRLDNTASHNSDGFMAQGYGSYSGTGTNYGDFVGLANSEYNTFSSTTANSIYYSGTQSGTATMNIGTGSANSRFPRYNNLNTASRAVNPISDIFANDNTTGGMYSYGNYYTWHAAIADLTYYNTNNQSASNTSLCPTGWHLPKGGNKTNETNNDFWALVVDEINEGTKPVNYSSSTYPYYNGATEANPVANRLKSYPNNFLYSGNYDSLSAYNRGINGVYWSSTSYDGSSEYHLGLKNTSVYPGTAYGSKYVASSIRCVVGSDFYSVHFDPNTTDNVSGIMLNQSIAIDETTSLETNAFRRPANSNTAYRFVKWNTKEDGTGTNYADGASITNLAPAGQTITLYAIWEQVSPMTITFDANGLSFADSSTTNTAYYYNYCRTRYISNPSYSHTSNINDDGTQIGTTKYDNNLATKDVVTIPGASSLHVTITYGTENNYDMLYVFRGEYTGSVTKNMSAGQLAKYMGGNNTTRTAELDISGDTATFAFYSDGSGQYWGYHASIVGYYDQEPVSYASTTQICSRILLNGGYEEPIIGDAQVFLGWSENQSAIAADYTTANSIIKDLPGDNGETKTLYAVWHNYYSVQYQDNGADNPNGMGTTDASTGDKSVKQTNVIGGTKITLLAPNFKKAGYSFLGWSTDQDAYIHFTDNDNTNDPIIYGPMEDVIIDSAILAAATNRHQINMYAIWIPALKDGSNNPVYFQEWDNPNTALLHDGCSTLAQTVFDDTVTDEKGKITATKDSIVALTDKRDNEVYTVARLADGNCWMTENLRLEAAGTVGYNTNDPNVTNQSLSQGYGGTTGTYGNFVGLATSESANFKDSTTANDIYKSDDSGSVFDSNAGTLEDIGTYSVYYRFPRYNNLNISSALTSPIYTENYANATDPSTSGTYKTSNVSSYGNYYTWAAAMANTNQYGSTSTSAVAGTSICPSGWRLPSLGQFSALSQGYSGTGSSDTMSNRFRAFPNDFLISGYFSGSTAYQRGTSSGYWVNSIPMGSGNYVYAHIWHLSSSTPSSTYMNKYYGYSIRCFSSSSDVEITLDANNGTGAVSRIYGVAGSSVTLPSNSSPSASIAQPYYVFSKWNTAPDGTGTSYTSSYTIPANSTSVTLYAQWTPQYTITYVDNCKSWAASDSNCTDDKSTSRSNQKIDLDASGNGSGTLGAYNKFTLTGWKIKEWTTNADGTGTAYPVSSTYSITGASAGDSITLYAHWIPVYTVQYDGNGSDNDSTGMGSTDTTTGIKTVAHTNVGEGDTFDLFASNFKKSSYGFVGWSTDANAWSKLTDNDATNDVKIWGPNEIFTAPAQNGTPIITLYAIWAPAETDGSNPVYLQNWTGCSAMTATTYDTTTGKFTVAKDSITALTDERDGNVYTIAKLADENCWMVENLRLDNTAELSTANTNIKSNNSTLPITNIYNADSSLATKSNFLSPSSSAAYNASSAPYGWCTTNSAACNDQSRLNITNTIATATPSTTQSITSANAHSDFSTTVYSYGNYYNWYSATAGYGTYSKTTNQPTDGDLCPAGWKLPYGNTGTSGSNIGNTKGGFYYLASRMGATSSNLVNSNKFRSFPNNFIYSGYWFGGSASNRGLYGYYWSSSAIDSNNTYNLSLNSTSVYPGNNGNRKYSGGSARCVSDS